MPAKSSGRTVIYTAITNQYDGLEPPKVIDEQCDYIAYVDDSVRSVPDPWKMERLVISERNPRVTSRIPKLLPHLFLRAYEYSIWVDARGVIKSDLSDLLHRSMERHSIALFAHPNRSCAYDEAEALIQLKFESPHTVQEQMSDYQAEGFPKGYGLSANGFIIRRHNDRRIIDAMNQWWMQVKLYSQRDQLSANYVFWKCGLEYYQIEGNLWDNPYVEFRDRHTFDAYLPE